MAPARPALACRIPRYSAIKGRRNSASTRSTRAVCCWARTPARLSAVLVLPSPMLGLEIPRTRRPGSVWSCAMRWPSTRYGSASKAVGVSRGTRCGATPARLSLPTSASGATIREEAALLRALKNLPMTRLSISLAQALELRVYLSELRWSLNNHERGSHNEDQAQDGSEPCQ